MMSLQRNYYEVLGLPPGATTDQIKKKYRELARKFHPDVVQDKAMGQRVFTQINQAYSVLGDPERRAQYNGSLSNGAASNGTASNGTASNGTASNGTASNGTASKTAAPAAKPAPQVAPSEPPSAQKLQAIGGLMSSAENAIMAGKPVEARAFCVRVLETDPRHVRALEVLGDALVQMGRREEAAVQYRRALEVAPSMLIQAKLNRVTQAAPSTRTVPPYQAPPVKNGNGTQKTIPPVDTSKDSDKASGLIGRLLKRK